MLDITFCSRASVDGICIISSDKCSSPCNSQARSQGEIIIALICDEIVHNFNITVFYVYHM